MSDEGMGGPLNFASQRVGGTQNVVSYESLSFVSIWRANKVGSDVRVSGSLNDVSVE